MTANRFCEHPNSVGETYGQHLRAAFGYSWRLFKGALGCALHGLMPWLCTSTGSALISDLHQELQARNAMADQNQQKRQSDSSGPLAADQPAL
ncbi:MAG: DUF6356 family protein [Pseudomonadales bacterium]